MFTFTAINVLLFALDGAAMRAGVQTGDRIIKVQNILILEKVLLLIYVFESF